MEWSVIQGVLSFVTGLAAIAAFYYARKKDTHDSSARDTEVIMELRTVVRDVGEMKGDIRAMRIEWREDHDKLVGMERDIKAIWKQVDKINGKETEQ